MSLTLKLDNYLSNNLVESANLDADSLAAATTLTLRSNQGLAAADFILVGLPGSEQAEIATIQALSGAAGLTFATGLKYPHSRFDPVNKLFGDKIKLYRAANVDGSQPADGSFSLLTTLALDPDQAMTTYTDSSGGAGFWYKYNYFNSTSSAETDLGDATAIRGRTYYCTIDDVRQKAGLQNNKWVTDNTIASARAAAQAEVDSELGGLYTVPFTQTPINALISTVTAQLAAGLLLTDDYGVNAAGTSKDGDAKLIGARALLARIKTKELILTDLKGSEIDNNAGTVQSWPDATTATTDEASAGGDHLFRISHTY
jgi:hypothetical protein